MANAIGKKIDLISVSLYFGLVLIGWLMILSVEADQIDLNSFSNIFSNKIVRSQSIWILISSAIFFVCAALDRKFWINLAYPLYALGIILKECFTYISPSEEFKTKFPHEAYTNEQNPIHWEKGKLVFENTFDTESSKEMPLGNIKKWNSGQYVILLESKDKFGQTVTDETRTTLFSDNDKSLSDQQIFSISTNKSIF